MFNLRFPAAFGEDFKTVTISFANGSGGDTLHLMFDNFYQGIIIKREAKWQVLFQLYTDEYTSADLDALVELIETKLK